MPNRDGWRESQGNMMLARFDNDNDEDVDGNFNNTIIHPTLEKTMAARDEQIPHFYSSPKAEENGLSDNINTIVEKSHRTLSQGQVFKVYPTSHLAGFDTRSFVGVPGSNLDSCAAVTKNASILGVPRAPNYKLSPAKKVLPGRRPPPRYKAVSTITSTRHERWVEPREVWIAKI